jgi:hypothetical protein
MEYRPKKGESCKIATLALNIFYVFGLLPLVAVVGRAPIKKYGMIWRENKIIL